MSVRLLRAIDKYFFWFFCILFGIFSKIIPNKFKQPKRILLIKLWAIGDSVITLVLLNALKKKFPKAKIDVLAKKRNVDAYTGIKVVNKIMLLNISNLFKSFRKYDLCFDCEPYLNTSALIALFVSKFRVGFSRQIRSILYHRSIRFRKDQHTVQNYLDMIRVLGISYDTDKLVELAYSNNDKQVVDKLLKNYGIKKGDYLIGISPGVAESVKSRMWPLKRFAELADKLSKKYNAKIFLIDGPSNALSDEKVESFMKTKPINLAGKLKLKETFYFMKKLDIFISNDTGPMHIAAAQGVKTIGLFGPNIPVLWRPFTKKGFALYHKVYCSPCIVNDKGIMPECIHKGTSKYQMCMKRINVNEVMNAIEIVRKRG